MSIRGLAIPAAIAIAGAVAGLAPATAMAASPAKAANNPAGPSAATRVVKIQTRPGGRVHGHGVMCQSAGFGADSA